MTSWTDFIDDWCARRDTNPSRVAALAGYDKSLVTGWKKGREPSVEYVRSTAIALDAPVVLAMLAAGYLSPGDVKAVEIERPLSDLDDDELLREIRRRLARAAADNVVALKSVDQPSDLDDDTPPPLHLADAARTEPGYTKSGERTENHPNE